jgi:hypothetical protein
MDVNANDVGFVPKRDDDLWRDESIRLCLLEISRDFLKSVEWAASHPSYAQEPKGAHNGSQGES